MLQTVLLLDGSEAMNRTNDYLPSYLLALRRPVCQFVQAYLGHSPLASLSVVVMRDGVSTRIASRTTSCGAVVDALERDYFLFGGSGTMSLENGLRHAMAELVDLKKVAALRRAAGGGHQRRGEGRAASKSRVVMLSASVTHIDPHDVFRTIGLTASLGIRVDAVALCGAVHVLAECAAATGGLLLCPVNYEHLHDMLARLVTVGGAAGAADGPGSRKRPRAHGSEMVRVGFPVMLADAGSGGATYLACPRCHLLQTSVPATCALCRLLLCSPALLYEAFVGQCAGALLPPRRHLTAVPLPERCAGCACPLGNGSSDGSSASLPYAHACTGCQATFCWSCHCVCTDAGLCCSCVSLS